MRVDQVQSRNAPCPRPSVHAHRLRMALQRTWAVRCQVSEPRRPLLPQRPVHRTFDVGPVAPEVFTEGSREHSLFWCSFWQSNGLATAPGYVPLRLTVRKCLIYNDFTCGFVPTGARKSLENPRVGGSIPPFVPPNSEPTGVRAGCSSRPTGSFESDDSQDGTAQLHVVRGVFRPRPSQRCAPAVLLRC